MDLHLGNKLDGLCVAIHRRESYRREIDTTSCNLQEIDGLHMRPYVCALPNLPDRTNLRTASTAHLVEQNIHWSSQYERHGLEASAERDGDDEVIDDDIKILQQYARHEQSRNEARSVEDPAATTASGKRGRSRSPRFARVERRTMTGKPGAEAFGRDRTVLERYTSALGHEDAPSPVGENAAQDDLPRKLSSESQGKGHHGVSDFYVGEKVTVFMKHDTRTTNGESRHHSGFWAWILARVVREVDGHGMVQIADENDYTTVWKLPASHVRRLEVASGLLQDDKVWAVFPGTTMFYRATVSGHQALIGNSQRVWVYFEDDGDEEGRPCHYRVSTRHVFLHEPSQGSTCGRQEMEKRREAGGDRRRSCCVGTISRDHPGCGSLGPDYRFSHPAVRNSGSSQQKRKESKPLVDMIAHAINKLEGCKGNLAEICAIIEADFGPGLNKRLESNTQKIPVWKASVRKVLSSNKRFTHTRVYPAKSRIFAMAARAHDK